MKFVMTREKAQELWIALENAIDSIPWPPGLSWGAGIDYCREKDCEELWLQAEIDEDVFDLEEADVWEKWGNLLFKKAGFTLTMKYAAEHYDTVKVWEIKKSKKK